MEYSHLIELRRQKKITEIAAMADYYEPNAEANIGNVLSIAEVYFQLKEYEKSILWYERAMDLGANEEDILTPLSELYRITWKNSKKWNLLYHKVVKEGFPDNQKNMVLYEKLLKEGAQEEKLINVLTSFVNEELFDLYVIELAEIYIKQDNCNEAKKLLRKVLRYSIQETYIAYSKELLEAINHGDKTYVIMNQGIRNKIYESENQSLSEDDLIITDNEKIQEVDNCKVSTNIIEDQKLNDDKSKYDLLKENKLLDLFRQNIKKSKDKKHIIKSIELLFEQVIGMQKVKEELQSFYDVLQYQNQLRTLGVGEDILIKNFIISGERGSGKTLVAGLLASMLEMFGLIDSDAIMEVNARDVIEAFSKDGNKGLIELFSELKDMVVVIDHIDRLFDDNENKMNHIGLTEGMVELMKARKDSLVFVMSGKKTAMDRFMNEDMKNLIYSRLDIPGYTTDELLEIACILAERKGFIVNNNAHRTLMKRIQIDRCSGEFANAISLESILQIAIKRKAERQRENEYDENASNLLQFEAEDFEVEDSVGENIEDLIHKLDGLTGLSSVKKEVRSKIESIIVQQNAMEIGAKRSENFGTLHMLFKGGPGTGKTTVARIIGKIYQKLGVLPKGNIFIECSRKDLVGEYQGHTAKKTHDKVIEALGGVLFIDEAYSLVSGQGDTFGIEALTTLVADIENYKDSIMVILAGYSEEIDQLIAQNPGLASRFPNEIIFEDYTIDEMTSIFSYIVRENGMVLDRNTSKVVHRLIKEKTGKRNFGNARGVRNLVELAKSSMDRRLVQMKSEGEILSRNDYDIMKVEDIESVIVQKSAQVKTLEELMEELNNMTGLSSVKRKVREMVALIKRNQLSEELNYKINNNFGSLHLVFLGNAGTGKTTVARLIGQLYEKLGVLKNGDIFVECSRTELIGQYQGQTTKRVEDKVKEAGGGILFIDEAYDLCHGNHDDYGREIVSTLLKAIEDKRDHLMVIMAGYKDKMEKFFSTNQGLKSRMSTEVYFEDYTVEELTQIFYDMAHSNSLIVEPGLEEFIQQKIADSLQRQSDFGNARGIRNIYENVLRKQALRLFDQDENTITREQFVTIVREDFM